MTTATITIRNAETDADLPRECQCPTCQATRHDFCIVCGYMAVALKDNTCTGCAPVAG